MTDQANVALTLGGTTENALPGTIPSLTIACTTQRPSIFVTAPVLLSRDAVPVQTQAQQPTQTQAQTQSRPRPQTEAQPATQTPAIPVRFRFDQREPVQQLWLPSPQRNVAFASDMRGFVERLVQSERLLLEITTRTGQPYRILFDVTGAEAVLPELQSCFRAATTAPGAATAR